MFRAKIFSHNSASVNALVKRVYGLGEDCVCKYGLPVEYGTNIRMATTLSAINVDNKTIAKDFSAMPGPKTWPIVGNVEYLRKGDSYHLLLMENVKKHGRLYKDKVFGTQGVAIADPDLAQKVYKAEGKVPIRDYNLVLGLMLKEKDELGFAKGLAAL